MHSVGVDIGGTFTDLVRYSESGIVMSKTSTVPSDPTAGIAECLSLADCDIPSLDELLHGSTIAINTVLERKGARMALLTTKGFRDVYAIGRGNRIEAFNLFFHRPQPLVPRDLIFEIPERILASGEILTPLDEDALRDIFRRLREAGIESVAVCLLHAYANPAHEIRIGELLRESDPDLFVTLSHEILREYREYERTSTTALNAFVGPRVRDYLRTLGRFLEKEAFSGRAQIMRSNGGVMSMAVAQEQPVSMMESGPVAGMIGAGRLARILGLESAVAFDMGGTTAKASLIRNGEPAIAAGYVIGDHASGQPMHLPVVDIVEVGAGGGSIAWLDAAGAIHVGPQSAGADPGPAAYGKGSMVPVVTDADLLLGRISAERFLGGRMALDRAASEKAMTHKIAGPLGIESPEAALGVTRIADAAMSLSVRAVSVQKGIDPRDTVLIAFGGAGPLHAVSIAREIHIPRVIIPKLPGTFSALGMLMAAWRQDFVQTLFGRLDALSIDDLERTIASLRAVGLDKLERDSIDVSAAEFAFFADLRYVGQEHALSIPITGASSLVEDVRAIRAAYNAEHERRYRQSSEHEPLELVSIRLVLTAGRGDGIVEAWLSEPWRSEGAVQETHRDVIFDDASNPRRARIFWRPSLPAGFSFTGPAVIEEPNSTTLVFPGDEAVIDDTGCILITLAAQA